MLFRSDIMEMKNGTMIKSIRSGSIYFLNDYVNDVAREIVSKKYGIKDYINKNTQSEYEVVVDDD